jgi:flagellar basal body-associated protein FliL
MAGDPKGGKPGDDLKVEGGPLPKKVELDIDDMFLEEVQEAEPPAPPPPPQSESAPVVEPESETDEKPAPRRKFPFKLALIAGGVVLVLAVAVVLAIPRLKPSPQTAHDAPAVGMAKPLQAELFPFVVTVAGPGEEQIVTFAVSVTFPSGNVQQEFESHEGVFRDLIFRFVSGRKNLDVARTQTKDELGKALTTLINQRLTSGKISQLAIIYLRSA